MSQSDIIKSLKNNGVGVMATDTIYGLVASALSPTAVNKIFQLKKRSPNKALIILIGQMKQLSLFGIKLTPTEQTLSHRLWPGKFSIILPCPQKKFAYLHRQNKCLAFRLPRSATLRKFLALSGPLVAPSANPEGLAPANKISQAKKYFGSQVDFYYAGRQRSSAPSTLVAIKHKKLMILRPGAGRVPKDLLK